MVGPGFYEWIVQKYPATLCSVVEDQSQLLPDTTKPNPNGVEFDNLFIHLNGIIHTCFHPQNLDAPRSYDDIFKFIFVYIDRVFSIVRPRKLLYLSVDGVAPRAKMNHQRILRFKAAQTEDFKGNAKTEDDKKLDSNVITPGTEFMDLLSSALKYYVHWRVNKDPGWRGIKVILSDSTVVGDGVDKIMSYIRSQRNLPGYNPNTRHCLHGMDDDMIIFALATHEIHISILREDITYGKKGQSYSVFMRELITGLEFEFFNLWVLREYLEREMLPKVKVTDVDRLVDDFVLMCCFVGNDFLPHLPSLVPYKGVNMLMWVYHQEFVNMGYLTNAPEVNLKSMEHFLQALSSYENTVLKHIQLKTEKIKGKNGHIDDSVQIQDESCMKHTHYTMNFDCISDDVDRIKSHAVFKYTEGICWIMRYYYLQVPSWQWFYPYHYAPLASDFCDLDKLEISFTLGQPFKPLDQLLGVLPAISAHALPLLYRDLMTNESSPIRDFYYKDVKGNGPRELLDSKDVCKLPFIDETCLLSETVKVEHTLTDEEMQRNRFSRDMIYVHSDHPIAKMIEDLPSSDTNSEVQIQIRPDLSDGMNGYMCNSDKPVFQFTEVKINCVKSVEYKCPSQAHIPKLSVGVIMPPRIVKRHFTPRPPGYYVRLRKKYPTTSVSQSKCEMKAGICLKDGSKVEGKQQNVINGESEVQQQIKAGNDDETQRDKKQAKGTEDEKLINTGICDEPNTEEHDLPCDELKKKRRKRKKVEAQQVELVDMPTETEEHEGKGPEPQLVKSVEELATCEEKPITEADGVHESPRGEPKRKQAKSKKVEAQQQADLVDIVEESMVRTGLANFQQEQPVALK